MRGKTISIYIPDGNPRSFKICELMEGIVRSLFIPRSRLKDFYDKSELKEPGVYFLFGEEDEVGKSRVYIGEADPLITRLKQHNTDKEKDFWKTVICFVSVKRNLNKAHIKFLENYCCEKAKELNRCTIENTTTPTRSTLTESERDFVLNFFDELKILISTLGYPIFEETKKEQKNILVCKGKDAYAEGIYSEDGFVVFKDSKTNLSESKTAGSWVKGMRDKLKEKGILIQKGNVRVFTADHIFNSPSAAAATILARRANGWTEWKNKEGKTLDEKIRRGK